MKTVDLVVIGGGPAGLCATINAIKSGANVLLIERDKHLGGQLVKQTHMFFGSEKQHASIRGFDIANILLDEISQYPEQVEIMSDTTVLGLYEDGVLTVENKGKYIKIKPRAIILATGASEKFSAFPNNDLPGIYGAGAVQTLMNVHGVKPGERALMVGAGNIGLIVAYQLMQAGVEIAAVIHHSDKIGGYHVHASKIRRMGVPIITNHAIKEAIGKDRVEKVVIWEMADRKTPIPGTEKELDVDTVCISVGLTPLVDLLAQAGCEMKYEHGSVVAKLDDTFQTTIPGIYVAGDAAGVEEASMAMVEGFLAGLSAAKYLGYVHEDYENLREDYLHQLAALRLGHGGARMDLVSEETVRANFPSIDRINKGPVAIVECFQNIPCNPCTTSCNRNAFNEMLDINDLPVIDVDICNGCTICVSKCPGMAIMVIDGSYSEDEVVFKIPYEFLPLPKVGDIVKGINRAGEYITDVKILRVTNPKSFDKTPIVNCIVNKDFLYDFRNIRLGDE